MSNEALAALGLDVTDTAVEPLATEAPAAVAEAVDAASDREEVDVGEIEVGRIMFIPTSQRSSGGSKYKFAALEAPSKEEGYSNFVVKLQPGVDEGKLKRSVQSATTQENKKQKDRGSPVYYVTRTINDKKTGEFSAIMVIRTDDRPEAEADEDAAA